MAEFAPPPARSVLVVAPHADDETLGCGGTVVLWRRAGVPVHVVVLSDGAAAAPTVGMPPEELVIVRENEAAAAAAVLDLAGLSFLRLPDGALGEHRPRLVAELRRLVAETAADLVLAPAPTDYHPDHLAAAEACFSLLAEGGFALAFYEVYGTTRFNVLVDISEVQAVKERALSCYTHGFLGAPAVFLEANRGLGRFRSFHARRLGYFEAFWHLPRFTGDDQLVSWILGGLPLPDPAASFVARLRATDALLDEVGRLAGEVAVRDRELAALRDQLAAVMGSRGWRALEWARRLRARLGALRHRR